MDTEIRSASRRRMDRVIRQSFIRLLQRMPFERITVRDLCAEADINRATFYRYYPDLYALKDEISDELFDRMFTRVALRGIAPAENGRSTIQEYLLEALTVAQDNLPLCRILLCDSKDGAFAYRLSNAFAEVFHQASGNQYRRGQEAELMFHYMANGIIGILRAWLGSDCSVERKEIARIIDEAVMSAYAQMNRFK